MVARWAERPIGPWSREITIFDPQREGAYGHYMQLPGSGLPSVPDASGLPDEQGLAYGAFILSPLTQWHSVDQTVELHYLLSTWRPCQVHHMRSRFSLD